MDIKEEKICRLCLNMSQNEYEVIDDTVREMLDSLLIKANLDISKDPVMCSMCWKMVRRCYMFKSMCVDTKAAFGKTETELEKIYLKEPSEDTDSGNIDLIDCQFCTRRVDGNSSITLDVRSDPKFKEMLSVLRSENDIDIVKNSTICTVCKENLDFYINFVLNCSNTEGKINTYCQHEGTNSTGIVELNRVLDFSSEDSLGNSNKCTEISETKQETCKSEIEVVPPEVHNQLVKTEVLDIKDETDDKDTPTGNKYNCSMCAYKTKYKGNLNHHMVIHKDGSETKMHKCTKCDWMSRHIRSLHRHMIIHRSASEQKTYKCTICTCTFETKYERNLTSHMLTHKDSSEVEIYKCVNCSYETRHQRYMKQHMLVHLDASEVSMHKCTMCTFESRRKGGLKIHMLSHKSSSELKMYNCKTCNYKTNHQGDFKTHILRHKDASEVEVYKCELCTYETRLKKNLKRHALIHKSISEVETFKCTMCPYESKYKKGLDRHVLTHKKASEVGTHRCTLCTYETIHKEGLKKHAITHKEPTEAQMYKCNICSFYTKYKKILERHISAHNSAPGPRLHDVYV